MTFRRQLVVSTLVIGGGVIAFQPMARYRMESRLSDIFGCPVKIGSSKISLSDGTISVRDLSVHRDPKSEAIRVPNAALKFDWNAALFRNLKVSTLLATDVRWTPTVPTSDQVPYAVVDSRRELANTIVTDVSGTNIRSTVESIALPIKQSIQSALSKQNESHLSIASRLLMLEERLRESNGGQSGPNPLRQSTVADLVRKELSLLRQSIAEDTLRYKEFERSLDEKKSDSASQIKQRLEPIVQSLQGDFKKRAIEVATSVIALEWNSTRPIAYALLQSLTTLQSDETRIPSETVTSRVISYPRPSIENLPVRFTRIAGGKVRGEMNPEALEGLADSSQPFELQFQNLSSEPTHKDSPPSIVLTLFDPNNSAVTWLNGTASYTPIPQSSSLQADIFLERSTSSETKRTTKIRQSSSGWTATIATQVEGCSVNGTLVGTTSSNLPISESMFIQLAPESVRALEQRINQQEQMKINQISSDLHAKAMQLMQEETLRMNSLASQIKDDFQRNHDTWESRMGVIVKELSRYESTTRTARRTTE